MIRVLVLIAVVGFFVSLVTISTAIGIGGPDVLSHAGWGWGSWAWDGDWDWDSHHHSRWRRFDGGPQTTRELAWTGGDTLEIDVPADVQYMQGPTAKLTVSGPERAVADLVVDGGHIRYDHRHRHGWSDLTIVMTAPSVQRFEISGSGKLAIAGYKQDRLDLDISGNADVSAVGEVREIKLDVSGSGDADLSGLKAKTAEVDIQGSGEAKLAPTDAARVDISGSGDVTLLTHPPKLETHVSGSGTLNQEDGAAAAPAAPAPPPPAPEPPPRHGKRT